MKKISNFGLSKESKITKIAQRITKWEAFLIGQAIIITLYFVLLPVAKSEI